MVTGKLLNPNSSKSSKESSLTNEEITDDLLLNPFFFYSLVGFYSFNEFMINTNGIDRK